MNKQLLIFLVLGLLVLGGTFVYATNSFESDSGLSSQTNVEALSCESSCGGACGGNCGVATCGAKTGGSCDCGQR